MQDFINCLADLKHSLKLAISNNIDLTEQKNNSLIDFKAKQKESIKKSLKNNISSLIKYSKKLEDNEDESVIEINKLTNKLANEKDIININRITHDIEKMFNKIKKPELERLRFDASIIPHEIKDDLSADFLELEKCFNASCLRSAVILCGRIIETSLHRKHYEVTGNDLLEKSPGIGLGNLLAKLNEKGIIIDPAISNQIHLINQIRIHSVHKKQNSFKPTKNQTQAVILYTIDIVEKLFSKS